MLEWGTVSWHGFSHAMHLGEHGFLKLNSLQAETDAKQPWPWDQLEQPH